MEDPERRSALMQRVRQRKTAPEERVARILRDLGIAYRRNVRTLPGSPDFANRSRGWALFVNGCYWHHHTGCRRATTPKSNRDFWERKFADNRRRDARKIRELRAAGLRVLIVWECELDDPEALAGKLSGLRRHGMPHSPAVTPSTRSRVASSPPSTGTSRTSSVIGPAPSGSVERSRGKRRGVPSRGGGKKA